MKSSSLFLLSFTILSFAAVSTGPRDLSFKRQHGCKRRCSYDLLLDLNDILQSALIIDTLGTDQCRHEGKASLEFYFRVAYASVIRRILLLHNPD
jgi:hypothetical protein